MTTAWRNGEYVVSYVKPGVRNLPPVGATLVKCGDKTAAQLAEERLDRWEGDLTTEAGRVAHRPLSAVDRNNPFTGGVPSLCTFKVGRRDRDFQMQPQRPTPPAWKRPIAPPSMRPAPIRCRFETVNGRPWINVHHLGRRRRLDAFSPPVEAQLPALRGRRGWSSTCVARTGRPLNATGRGYGLANRIWTPEFTVSRQPEAGSITYRATQANRQWFADTLARMQADPRFVAESGPVIEQTQAIVAAFDSALAANQATFTLPGRPSVPDTGAANPVAGPVVVLVDGGCTSGCLDTLDLLTRLPNVRWPGRSRPRIRSSSSPPCCCLPSNYAS